MRLNETQESQNDEEMKQVNISEVAEAGQEFRESIQEDTIPLLNRDHHMYDESIDYTEHEQEQQSTRQKTENGARAIR